MCAKLQTRIGFLGAMLPYIWAMPNQPASERPEFLLPNPNADQQLPSRFAMVYGTPEIFDMLIGLRWQQNLLEHSPLTEEQVNGPKSVGEVSPVKVEGKPVQWTGLVRMYGTDGFSDICNSANVAQSAGSGCAASRAKVNVNFALARPMYHFPQRNEYWFLVTGADQPGLFVLQEIVGDKTPADYKTWHEDETTTSKLEQVRAYLLEEQTSPETQNELDSREAQDSTASLLANAVEVIEGLLDEKREAAKLLPLMSLDRMKRIRFKL